MASMIVESAIKTSTTFSKCFDRSVAFFIAKGARNDILAVVLVRDARRTGDYDPSDCESATKALSSPGFNVAARLVFVPLVNSFALD